MPVSFALSTLNDGSVVGKRQDSMNSKNRWVPNLVEG